MILTFMKIIITTIYVACKCGPERTIMSLYIPSFNVYQSYEIYVNIPNFRLGRGYVTCQRLNGE